MRKKKRKKLTGPSHANHYDGLTWCDARTDWSWKDDGIAVIGNMGPPEDLGAVTCVECLERIAEYGQEAGRQIQALESHSQKTSTRRFELASTAAINALLPHVGEILHAIAVVVAEPAFAHALVTDESYFSDFGLEAGDYAKLSTALGIEIDPDPNSDDRFIYRVAAKLKVKGAA